MFGWGGVQIPAAVIRVLGISIIVLEAVFQILTHQ